jgi:hypothetical protein
MSQPLTHGDPGSDPIIQREVVDRVQRLTGQDPVAAKALAVMPT